MIGAELDEYIEGSFETKLVDEGFAPLDALNPTNSVNPVDVKTLLVTIQSVSITNLDTMFSPPMASINIAGHPSSLLDAIFNLQVWDFTERRKGAIHRGRL
jgi:hypothetical protein